jgi:hypothetical protein
MGEGRGAHRVLVVKPDGKRWLRRPRKIILKRIFRKWDVGIWTGSSLHRIGTGGEHL